MKNQLKLFKQFENEPEKKKIKTDNLTQIGSSAHADHEREKNDFYERSEKSSSLTPSF